MVRLRAELPTIPSPSPFSIMLDVLLAGGGTGGHLFPGIALARTLQGRGHAVRFLCTDREFDAEQLARCGLEFRALPSPSWRGKISGFGDFALRLAGAVEEALGDLRARPPDAVIGLGGFGCAPPVAAARLRGIPTGLLEQNVIPGKANRLLARGVRQVFCQWNEAIARFGRGVQCVESGSPLRAELAVGDRLAARRSLGFDPGLPLLLVLGGSQGALGINGFLQANAGRLALYRDRMQVFCLAGGKETEGLRQAFARAGVRARVEGFWTDMPTAYRAADLAVSRSGGMSLAELVRMRLPAILIPFPHAAEGHQEANARVFAAYGGLCVPEASLRPEMWDEWIAEGLLNSRRIQEWGSRLGALDHPDAGGLIADAIEGWCTRGEWDGPRRGPVGPAG